MIRIPCLRFEGLMEAVMEVKVMVVVARGEEVECCLHPRFGMLAGQHIHSL